MLQLFLFLRNLLWIKLAPSSYRPISNLDFIWKILERLFFARIQSHITSSLSFNQYQSAYRRRHSTETSILHTLDSILLSSDSGKSLIIFGRMLLEKWNRMVYFPVLFQVTYKECQAEHEILLERNEVCRKYEDSDHPHNAGLFPCLISSHN